MGIGGQQSSLEAISGGELNRSTNQNRVLVACVLCLLTQSLSKTFPSAGVGDRGSGRIAGFAAATRKTRMNKLFSGVGSSFGTHDGKQDLESGGGIQMMQQQSASSRGTNLDKFFEDVEGVKDELRDLEALQRSLHDSNENSKTLHQSSAIRALRARMDADVATALKKAKLVKIRLESLDRANAANRSLPDCGLNSSTDRTRTSVVAGLRRKLRDTMEAFNGVRETAASDYREAVERRYYTVTGAKPDDATLDTLISTGEAERFLQLAIQQEGGRGEVMTVITEIRERYGASKELERSLAELHQVFLDMSVLVAAQGEQIDDIENQVNRASSFVRGGAERLQYARNYQKNTRKWACIGIAILIIIILIIVIPIVARKS